MISIIATRNFDVVVNSCWVKKARLRCFWLDESSCFAKSAF